MTNDGLTGFAASWDTWNATRTPDGDSAMHEGNDSGYDPDPALPVTSLTAHDHYSAVGGTGTYVTGYHVNFHAHTSIATAQADVLTGEFPPDAKWLWQRAVPGQCYLAEVKSATLAKDEKAAGLGDSSGDAFAEFQTDPPGAQAATYNPKNVTFAAVSWGTYPVTPEDAVGC